jgi:hypothetical protein
MRRFSHRFGAAGLEVGNHRYARVAGVHRELVSSDYGHAGVGVDRELGVAHRRRMVDTSVTTPASLSMVPRP